MRWPALLQRWSVVIDEMIQLINIFSTSISHLMRFCLVLFICIWCTTAGSREILKRHTPTEVRLLFGAQIKTSLQVSTGGKASLTAAASASRPICWVSKATQFNSDIWPLWPQNTLVTCAKEKNKGGGQGWSSVWQRCCYHWESWSPLKKNAVGICEPAAC